METHKRTLGIIYICSAVFYGFAMIVVGLVMGFVLDVIQEEFAAMHSPFTDYIFDFLSYLPMIIFVCIVLPSLIAGIGLLMHQSWALTLALIVGCFKLFTFPIGTAIGAYAIWVYAKNREFERNAATRV